MIFKVQVDFRAELWSQLVTCAFGFFFLIFTFPITRAAGNLFRIVGWECKSLDCAAEYAKRISEADMIPPHFPYNSYLASQNR